ncbi:hypothetical protein ACFQ0G_48885 [Streptomyces chiangmaiensis]
MRGPEGCTGSSKTNETAFGAVGTAPSMAGEANSSTACACAEADVVSSPATASSITAARRAAVRPKKPRIPNT